MKSEKVILISAMAVALTFSGIAAEGATKKKTAAPKKAKAKTEAKVEKKQIETSEAFYDKMWEKYQIGTKEDKAEVIKTLKGIIKVTPDEYMAYYYLGIMTSEDSSTVNQAIRYFEDALTGFPKSADIHIRMAKLLDEKNKEDEALDHYKQALALDQENPIALSKVGLAELKNKNYEKAGEYLKKAKNLEPDNVETLRGLGEFWLNQGNYTGAIEILDQAILFDQTHAATHLLLGQAYEKNGNHDKAAEHTTLAAKYGKKDDNITEAIGYALARNLSKSGKFEEAIAAYKKEIKKNSDPAQGYFEMAETYEQLEDFKSAIKSYQKAFELNKKMASGIFRSAEIYAEEGNTNKARELLKQLKNNPEFGNKALDMLESMDKDEELKAERELAEKLSSKSTSDGELEEAYKTMYDSNKKDTANLEKLYKFYEERGYYDEALTWFRRYAKASNISSVDKKNTEQELKDRLEQDNYYLFGDKKEDKPSKSKVSSDDLMNQAFNGDNDRIKELSFQILLSRKDYKEDKKLLEGIVKFYEERGKAKDASKYINKMKSLGYLSESEAKDRKNSMKK